MRQRLAEIEGRHLPPKVTPMAQLRDQVALTAARVDSVAPDTFGAPPKPASRCRPIVNLRISSLPFPVCETPEQQEIVRRIETAFAWLDRVAAEHTNASRLLPRLDQAILAKAFRGELVPHDPNDKPVEISADTTAESPSRRGHLRQASN